MLTCLLYSHWKKFFFNTLLTRRKKQKKLTSLSSVFIWKWQKIALVCNFYFLFFSSSLQLSPNPTLKDTALWNKLINHIVQGCTFLFSVSDSLWFGGVNRTAVQVCIWLWHSTMKWLTGDFVSFTSNYFSEYLLFTHPIRQGIFF